MTDIQPLKFDLCFRKQVKNRMGGVWVDASEEEAAEVPDVPEGFEPQRAYHGEIAQRADVLNRAQERSGFMRYFFFPEVAQAEDAR